MTVACWILGFGIGAVVVGANFWALAVTVPRLLQPGARAPRLAGALAFGARLLAAGLALGLALRYLPVSPVAMLLGVSVVPLALMVKVIMQPAHLTTKGT